MGLLETKGIEDLLHSSTISKGIERTMERIADYLNIDRMFIVHHQEFMDEAKIIYDWDKGQQKVSFDVATYIQFLNESYHFDKQELFLIPSKKALLDEEKVYYERFQTETLIEFQMKNHGHIIGYIVVEWDCVYQLSEENQRELHILLKLINEQLIKKFHRGILGGNNGRLLKLANSMTNTLIFLLDEKLKIQFLNELAKTTYPNLKVGDYCYQAIKGENCICKDCLIKELKMNKIVEKQMYFPYLDDNFHVNGTSVMFRENENGYLFTMQKLPNLESGNRRELVDDKFIFALQTLYKDIIAVEIRRDAFYNLFKEDYSNKYSYSMDFVLKWLSKVHGDDKQRFLECFDINFLQNAYLKGEEHKEIDFRYRTHADDYHCMNAHILFEKNANKDVTVYILLQDVEEVRSVQIEEVKRLKDALMAARSSAELKTEVLANISHEIQSPVSGIISMSAVAKQVYKEEQKVLQCLEKIDDCAEHMKQVMDYLLQTVNVSDDEITIRKQSFILENFLNRLDIATRKSIKQKNIAFNIESHCQYRKICGDEIRLYQAICTLLNYSVSGISSSGFIQLSVNQMAVDDKILYLRFAIEYTGNGFSDKMKESLFGFQLDSEDNYVDEEHFELSLAGKLITLMGGQMGIEMKEERTYLYFTIPFAIQENKEKHIKKKQTYHGIGLKGKKILLAEDSEMTQGAFQAILEVVGCTVDIVENGKKAVVKFISQPANTYDAILMDVHMPFMDGREATKCIRISGKEDADTIPIIGLMANTSKEDIEESLEAGMQAHLAKPVDVDKLYSILHKVLIENKEKFEQEEK